MKRGITSSHQTRLQARTRKLLIGAGIAVFCLFILLSITMNTLVTSWKPLRSTIDRFSPQETSPPELNDDYEYAMKPGDLKKNLSNGTDGANGTNGMAPGSSRSGQDQDFVASFTIMTNGIVRSFATPMYWNQSDAAYLTPEAPSVIYVQKSGITWGQFFDTLPFSLSKQCLVTGDQETFCEDEENQLRFYLNDLEEPNLLQLSIHRHDHAEIIFEAR